MEGSGYLNSCRYLLHDRDPKFCQEFRDALATGVECTRLPPRIPNFEHPRGALGMFDQREMLVTADPVRSELTTARPVRISENTTTKTIKARTILCFSPSLAPLERNPGRPTGCRERLAGLLKYYGPAA